MILNVTTDRDDIISMGNYDKNISSNKYQKQEILIPISSISNAVGQTVITFTLSHSGKIFIRKVYFNVYPKGDVDISSPVIRTLGSNPVNTAYGSAYKDAGAIATDNIDEKVIVRTSGFVDPSKVGTYILTYTAEDKVGNKAIAVTRTVHVTDKTPPVIELSGEKSISIVYGSIYEDTGAIATDNIDDKVTVKTNGFVNTSKAGMYTLTYVATDKAGNKAKSIIRKVKVADRARPVIRMSGSSSIGIAYGSTYEDAGATARDSIDEKITVQSSGTVNTSKVGTYRITYTAIDSGGNKAVKVRTVYVRDKTPPIIKILGENPLYIEVGNFGVNYQDPGAVATDNVDGIVRVNTGFSASITRVGTYTVTYMAMDKEGNKAQPMTRTAHVIDRIKPIIKLKGSDLISVNHGSNYTENGASATDNVDGYNVKRIIIKGSVNTLKTGSYVLTYTAIDKAGNESKAVTRTVNVVDREAPIIQMLGVNHLNINYGSTYEDAGAIATDNADDNVTVKTYGIVNTSVIGAYTITYRAVDKAGYHAKPISRTIYVVDKTPPIIEILGKNPVVINYGDKYNGDYDAYGARAIDNVDGRVNVKFSGQVFPSKIGTYILTYTATDKSGNQAKATKTVYVIDKKSPPVITLLGENPAIVKHGYTYKDAGATAIDDVDKTVKVTSTGSVDTSKTGTYTRTYTAVDKAGNEAKDITRTVHVVDQTPPSIKITGDNPVTILQHSTYRDFGAKAEDNVDDVVDIKQSGSVDTTKIGTYTITYVAKDKAENEKTEKRIIIVSAFKGGEGTPEEPYQITDCQQLQRMQDYIYSHFILKNDIDCSNTINWNNGKGFNPIGDNESDDFFGSFDGKNYTISNLYINRLDHYVGLFGEVVSSHISNIKFTGADIKGTSSRGYYSAVGVLAGKTVGSKISNILVFSGKVTSNTVAGGIIGHMYVSDDDFIEDSYSAASVSVNSSDFGAAYYHEVYAGGLIGSINSSGRSKFGGVRKSYSVGAVAVNISNSTELKMLIGGLVGTLVSGSSGGDIINSYSLSAITVTLNNVDLYYEGSATTGISIGGLTGSPFKVIFCTKL